jgi:prepilin-type N-terminal cleavage/methylation domain-containing protein
MNSPSPALAASFHGERGMTLIEVMTAVMLIAVLFTGIIGGIIQAHRIGASSVAQASVLATVESDMEQMKSMPLSQLLGSPDAYGNYPSSTWTKASWPIPTLGSDPVPANNGLVWSDPAQIPNPSTLVAGQNPTINNSHNVIVDNLKNIIADPNNEGAATSWSSIWPGAIQLPGTNPKSNDLHLNIWVWVSDLSNPGSNVQGAYGITIIYTWQLNDGFGTKYFMGTLHAIRSTLS